MSKFKTEQLKKLVAYAIQGAGFDKLFELSTYLGIRVSDNTLYLNTTDGTNYMCVSGACEAEDMDITVDADLFAKLISKINTDTVDLKVVDNTLVVTGNGKYTLGLKPNENGDMLSFPDKFPDDADTIGTISANDIVTIKTTLGASLSNIAGSVYSNYYVGDVVVGTDKAMMGIFNKKIFDDAYLFNRNIINLVAIGNDVTVSKSSDMLVIEVAIDTNADISVCTKIDSAISDFSVDAVQKFKALEAKSFCRFKKAEMLDLLDRLSLFVSKFDDGAIELHFTQDAIEVSSLASDGVESVAVSEFKDAADMTIKMNIDRFKNQLKAYSSDTVDLYYGSEICIKLVDNDIMQIIAVMN